MYRVVIAEDEMLVRLGLRNAIHWERFGMEVIADVPNGREALLVYQREKPDIIITDLRMPVMGGIELIEQIRQKDADTKIIILTCVEEFETVRKAIHFGVREYILKLTMKPLEMEEVLERVAGELERNTKGAPLPLADENLLIGKLFKDYMFRQLYTAEELGDILRKMDRPLQDRALLVLVMEIGGFSRLQERLKDDKGDLAAFTLMNVLGEIFEPYGRGELFHDERNRFIAILSFGDVVSEQKREHLLQELARNIRHSLKTLYGVPVFFSASTVRNGFAMLSSLYREALNGLEAVFVTGMDRLLQSAASKSLKVEEDIGTKMRRLEISGDAFPYPSFRQQLRVKIDAFLQGLLNEPVSRKKMLHFIVQLTQLPAVFFRMCDEDGQGRISLRYHERLIGCDTLDDAIDSFSAYICELAALYEAQRPFASKEVADAVRYIGRYCQRDLSLKDIADEIGMSPNYFSTLFAKETGYGVIDYIQLQRVEKAKQLLAQSRLKSYEVAAQVGFTDHSYFSKVFKKLTGFNPREYRRQSHGEGIFEDENEQAEL